MSNPTTPFGWQMPEATDLVTDLPADFEVFGQAVATDLQYLLGGTTGQILSKTNATDLNFAWVAPTAGDIEGVTAGIGISGGGTSGTVTVTNDMATTITAAGDIVVGTGSGTYDNLPIGTTNQILTADTTVSPYKVKWATPASGGINFAENRVNDYESTSSGTYTNLTTTQAVTLTTGTKVMVAIGANLYATTNNARPHVSYAVSGATTTSASDTWSIGTEISTAAALRLQMSYVSYQTVTAGSNTFTMKYRSAGENPSVSFFNRQIIVIDLGS